MPYQYPYGFQPQYQQPIHGFVYVNGIEGARAYQMPPNSEMPLFDNANDVLYIKVTDGAGFPTITVADVLPRKQEEPKSEDVSRDELDRMYGDLARQIEELKEALHGIVPATAAAAEPDAGAVANGKRKPAGRVQPASQQ